MSQGHKNWQQVLTAGTRFLDGEGIDNPAGDARWLLAHALDINTDRLTLVLHDRVTPAQLVRFDRFLQRRAQREPVSHIIGAREFYGRRFIVSGDVLDPRPETELLVDVAKEHPFERILDLGTGSGCVVLSALAEVTDARGIGSDLSEPALAIAGRNAQRLGLDGRCAFVCSDWYKSIGDRFDLITSNPPYISAQEYSELALDVTGYEPKIALTPGGDGLDSYRKITGGALDHLVPGGRLIVEIGPTQARDVVDLFKRAGLTNVEIRNDLDGRNRVIIGARPV